MPSRAEAVLAALAAALAAALPGVRVARGGGLTEEVGAAGLINLADSTPEELDELLGGRREWRLEAGVEIAVALADDALRAAALDALATTAAAAILADPALAALADAVRVGETADPQTIAAPGAAAIGVRTLPVEIHYATGRNPHEEI